MIKESWSAIAGTLNPHAPKKTVASTQILDWIAGRSGPLLDEGRRVVVF
jgi:hypothetical protein